jgi:hypothetical protein
MESTCQSPAAQSAFTEPDYPNVSANFIVMAALRGGHPEKHGYSSFTAGSPGQARP